MASARNRNRPRVALRHKLLGCIFLIMGLTCLAGSALLSQYLIFHFLGGYTWEALTGDLVCVVMGLGFLALAWMQWVVEPRRQAQEEALNRARFGPGYQG